MHSHYYFFFFACLSSLLVLGPLGAPFFAFQVKLMPLRRSIRFCVRLDGRPCRSIW